MVVNIIEEIYIVLYIGYNGGGNLIYNSRANFPEEITMNRNQ